MHPDATRVSKAVSVRKASHNPTALSDENVARRAHEIYLATGRREGFAAQDWREAERQLRENDPPGVPADDPTPDA